MADLNSKKYFESQQPDEKVVILVRRHPIVLMPVLGIVILVYMIGFLAIFVLPVYIPALVTGFAYNVYVLVVSLAFLFNTIYLFSDWVLYYLHIALLTTEHFVDIDQYGLLGRKVSSLTLDKIQDVSNDQLGLIHTVFNLGFVQIQTAGEAPNFEMDYVPNPDKICQAILETEEEYSSRHGIRGNGINGSAHSHGEQVAAPEVVPEQKSEPTIEYPGE